MPPSIPHGQNAHEFELMVEAGHAADVHPAGGDDQCRPTAQARQGPGLLARARLADVIAVPGDPIANISLMKQVSFVMKDGVVYKLNGAPVEH